MLSKNNNNNNNNLINKPYFNSAFSSINNQCPAAQNNNQNNDSVISSSISMNNNIKPKRISDIGLENLAKEGSDFVSKKRKRDTYLIIKNNNNFQFKNQIYTSGNFENPLNPLKSAKSEENSVTFYELKHSKSALPGVKNLYAILKNKEELLFVLENVVRKTKREMRKKMLKNDDDYVTEEDIDKNLRISAVLLFDSQTDGDRAKTFHEKCDYKRCTLTVLETNKDQRFGGYTNEYFESPDEWFDKEDSNAFVFSLTNKKIYNVLKNSPAISCDKEYGPYFRDDHICIVDKFLSNESGTCSKGKNFNTTRNYELNGGKKFFIVKRLQVFKFKINDC